MKKLLVILITTLFITIGCEKNINPNIIEKDDIANCSSACAHVKSLNCEEGQDLVYPVKCSINAECDNGICINENCTETCEMVCEAFIKEGIQLGLECWTTVDSCPKIESVCRAN